MTLVAVVAVLTVGAEVAVRYWNSSKACVQVFNEGDAAMDDLVIRYSSTKVELGRLRPGLSAKAWFTAAGRGPLHLEFRQSDNPLKGFQIDDFNPDEINRTGSKLVLVVKNKRIERFMEADESAMSVQNLSDKIRGWIRL
jgi:hypothetical protein